MLYFDTRQLQVVKLLGLYLVTIFVLLPLLCYYLPFSVWYDFYHSKNDMKKQALALNEERLSKAQEYLKNLDPMKSVKFYEEALSRDIDIVVAIVTVKRNYKNGNNSGYLTQTVASMDKIIKTDIKFGFKYMFVCNVNEPAFAHVEAESIEKYIPVIRIYQDDDKQYTLRNAFKNKTSRIDIFEKETLDYMFCLKKAKQLDANYVLLLQDDVIACSSLFDILWNKLKNQLASRRFSHIKLYYPEKWQGYAFELNTEAELISFAAVGAGIFLLSYSVTKRYRALYYTKVLYFVFGAIFTFTVVYTLGRQTLLELRRMTSLDCMHYVKKSEECCTPAMLYPNGVIPELIDFIGKENIRQNFHLDLAINEFVVERQYSAYQIEPNLFRHTGMHTSLAHRSSKQPREFLFTAC